MADLNITSGKAANYADHIPTIWAKDLEREAQSIQLFKDYLGEAIVVKEDLTKNPGDTIRISKIANLTAGGGDLTDGVKLKGNEEALSLTKVDFTPTEHGKAVAYTKQAKEKVTFEMRKEASLALSNWAGDKMDLTMWAAAIIGSNVLYGGDAAATNDIEQVDKVSTTLISKAAALLRKNKARKLSDGYYHMLVHPYQAYDLKQDTTFMAAQREAANRGPSNLLFTGVRANVVGFWDGVVILETDNVTNSTNTSSIYVYRSIIFGARCLGRAISRKWDWAEEKDDYGREVGFATTNMHQDKILNGEYLYRVETSATQLA